MRSRGPSPSTTPTSPGISGNPDILKRRCPIDTNNGDSQAEPVDLHDTIVVETDDGERLEYEVVALVEDEDGNTYAVCYNEGATEVGEFVVTDASGKLLEDGPMAQEIIEEFLERVDDEPDEGPGTPSKNGETP